MVCSLHKLSVRHEKAEKLAITKRAILFEESADHFRTVFLVLYMAKHKVF